MIVLNFLLGSTVTLIVAVCYIITIAFTVWMMIDAGKQDRFWWLTVIIGVPVIGPAVYYFTEKKHEYRSAPLHYVHTSETEQQHEKTPKKKSSRKVKKEVSTESSTPSNEEVKVAESSENKVADTAVSA